MKKLKDILYKVAINKVVGNTAATINKVVFDSRSVQKNDVFVAQKGTAVDGHQFIDKAIKLGAVVVICQEIPSERKQGITYIEVADSKVALGILAGNFYGNPSDKLKLIGITGTNGKTTVATLLYRLFTKANYKTGLLSTVKILIAEMVYEVTHTTPDAVAIHRYLAKMVAAGVQYCFMEVSSHGIDQKRTAGLNFTGGVFTNLTQEHLDYHKTFLAYRDVKKSFFDHLPKRAFALVNVDDKNGAVMLQNTRAKKQTYALKTGADFKANILEKQLSGTLLKIDGVEFWTKLIGTFNAYNLLSVIATAELLGLEKTTILRIVSELESVKGRFEYTVSGNGITAIIDYAHTPDALQKVLETISEIKIGSEKIITVVGCGGDRDRTKRPKMAHIASRLSDQVIFTSDNPRGENPQVIIDQMEVGVLSKNQEKTLAILDRNQAIKTACKFAKSGDILLIAGKGHETYQEINGRRLPFDDFQVVTNYFKQFKNE